MSKMLAFLAPQEAMSQKLEANTTISGSLPVRFLKACHHLHHPYTGAHSCCAHTKSVCALCPNAQARLLHHIPNLEMLHARVYPYSAQYIHDKSPHVALLIPIMSWEGHAADDILGDWCMAEGIHRGSAPSTRPSCCSGRAHQVTRPRHMSGRSWQSLSCIQSSDRTQTSEGPHPPLAPEHRGKACVNNVG